MKTRAATARRTKLKIEIDPALDKAPLPAVFAEKAARAKEFLEKHPIPEHLIKR